MGAGLHALALIGASAGVRPALRAWHYLVRAGQDDPTLRLTIVFALGTLGALLAGGAALMELRALVRGRHPDGTSALLRKAFAAVVLAWLWTVFAQPELLHEQPILSLTLSVASLIFGAASLAAHLPLRLFPRPARVALDLSVFSLCAAALLAEVGLQIGSRLAPSPLLARQDTGGDADGILRAFRLAPRFMRLGMRTNSGGYVDEEFLAERRMPRRVVAIGDSFSVGVVPHAYHFSTVAEGLLGDTEICNMGVSSIGPRQYLRLLRQEALPLAPDLILVNLYAGNDLEADFTPPDQPDIPRMLYRRNVLLYLVATRLRALSRERARLAQSGQRLDGSADQGLQAAGGEVSRAELARLLPHLERPELEEPVLSAERFMELEVQRALKACGPATEDYARLFENLADLCAAADDTPLAVMLIPDEFQVDDELWEQVLAKKGDVALERDRFQREATAFLKTRGIPVLDLLPDLRAVPPMEDGRTHLFHLRDTHFNARGNLAAGTALAAFLGPLLPQPAQR